MSTSTEHSAARNVVLVGWAAKGLVYLALAWLVLQLAFGSAPQQATTTGALQYIAQTAPGTIAIVLVGLGLLAHAVGRVLEVTVLARPQIGGKDKAEAAVLALLYLSLAVSAFSIVGFAGTGSSGGSGSGSGSETGPQQGSALLLGLPGGEWLVGLAGLLVIAFGLLQIARGISSAFLPTLRLADMPDGLRKAADPLGTAAYVTKGALFVLLGGFLVQAALTYDPAQARGLDAALREIAQQSWGQVVLTVAALGLFAYAAFTFLEARYRRVGVSATSTA